MKRCRKSSGSIILHGTVTWLLKDQTYLQIGLQDIRSLKQRPLSEYGAGTGRVDDSGVLYTSGVELKTVAREISATISGIRTVCEFVVQAPP